jgi:CBS-domain-containing membrane protein
LFAARPEPLCKLCIEPRLRPRRRHDDPLPRKQIGIPAEEVDSGLDHFRETIDIVDLE